MASILALNGCPESVDHYRKLHELTTYAGHRDPKTTLIYLHLSGADLTAKMAHSVGSLDARMFCELFGSEALL